MISFDFESVTQYLVLWTRLDIRIILNNESLLEKYEDFMLRRVLAADPDSRWCPAPDCGFVVLANGCASCPRLLCQRPGCGSSFCYHCKVIMIIIYCYYYYYYY